MFIFSEGMGGLCGSPPRWKTKINFPKKTNKSLILLVYINMLALFDIPFSSFHLTLVFNFRPQQWFLLLAAARARCELYSLL